MPDRAAGSPVQSCGASPQAPPDALPATAAPDLTHRIEFHFAIESGQPIGDPRGFILIHPDGSEEKGALANGAFERAGVPEGAYQMKFQYIETCDWESDSAIGEPTVAMSASAHGFPDGTAASFQVFRRFETTLTPEAKATAHLSDGAASARFSYKQKVSGQAGGDFIFQVTVGGKQAFSGVLTIQPYPLDMLAGVQQRLKQLGFDSGPIDGILGPRTEAATRQFQKLNPELTLDGIPGPLTTRELSNA